MPTITPESLRATAAAIEAQKADLPIQVQFAREGKWETWFLGEIDDRYINKHNFRPAPLGFPDLPPGEEWHNPDGLTPEQVEVHKGWRLLTKKEISTRIEDLSCGMLNGEQWQRHHRKFIDNGCLGNYPGATYRTRDPLPVVPEWTMPEPPKGKRWHRDDWTKDMLPDGTRPLLMDEVIEIGDKALHETDRNWMIVSGAIGNKANQHHWMLRTHRPLPRDPEPWNCEEDAPGPMLWIRGKVGSSVNRVQRLVICIQSVGVSWLIGEGGFVPWSELAEKWEHSTDRKTWKPCVKESK